MKKQVYQDEFTNRSALRQRRIRKKRLIIFFISFILVMLAVGVTLSLTVFFPIESLTAGGSEIYDSVQIVSASGISAGDNLFTFSSDEITENIRARLPYIKTVTVKRSLPGSVSIKVTDAKKYAGYLLDGAYYIVGNDGFVLEACDASPENVFIIDTANGVKCSTGSYIEYKDGETEEIVESMISGFEENGITVNTIEAGDKLALTAKVEGRFEVNFGSNSNIDKKIAHLSGMIKSIDSSKTGKINLSMWTSKRTEGTFVEQNIG